MLARRSSGAARLVCGNLLLGGVFWRWWKTRRRGAEPSAASGGKSEAEAQCARELKEAALAATHNDLCELREPSAASGGYSEAEAQCARELKEAALAATPNDLCELREPSAASGGKSEAEAQ